MNQNFKKHLEASYTQAFAECAKTGHKIGDLDAIFNGIVMKTFAELIVRECADYAFSDEQDHRTMLKHFGVES
jgi:c-di-AMP phosphodiesterase-like protein